MMSLLFIILIGYVSSILCNLHVICRPLKLRFGNLDPEVCGLLVLSCISYSVLAKECYDEEGEEKKVMLC